MATLSITWRTVGDDRVCPICQQLEGYEWIFETGTNQSLPQELTHPTFGVVWNIQLGSEAHGNHNGSCRCHMEPHFDLSDIVAKTQKLYDEVAAAAPTEEPMKV